MGRTWSAMALAMNWPNIWKRKHVSLYHKSIVLSLWQHAEMVWLNGYRSTKIYHDNKKKKKTFWQTSSSELLSLLFISFTCGASGVSSMRSGSSLSILSKARAMSLCDSILPDRSDSRREVSSLWLALPSRDRDTAMEENSYLWGPRLSPFSNICQDWKQI